MLRLFQLQSVCDGTIVEAFFLLPFAPYIMKNYIENYK